MSTWSQFYGHWFLVDRDVTAFVVLLTTCAKTDEHQLDKQWAQKAADALKSRFDQYDHLERDSAPNTIDVRE
jgi:hypothetical protein